MTEPIETRLLSAGLNLDLELKGGAVCMMAATDERDLLYEGANTISQLREDVVMAEANVLDLANTVDNLRAELNSARLLIVAQRKAVKALNGRLPPYGVVLLGWTWSYLRGCWQYKKPHCNGQGAFADAEVLPSGDWHVYIWEDGIKEHWDGSGQGERSPAEACVAALAKLKEIEEETHD